MCISENLEKLNFILPKATNPGGKYQSVNIRGNIAYVAIQFPINNDKYLYQGKLGKQISTEQGYKAMQLCALNVISQIKEKIGYQNIVGLNHIDIYYRSIKKWDEAPNIADGASELFINVLKNQGQHSRAIFGVQNLPRNFSVGLTATFTINKI